MSLAQGTACNAHACDEPCGPALHRPAQGLPGLDRVEAASAMCPLLAPRLEQIRVIGFECEGESHRKFREAVIMDAEAFIAGSLPEEPHPAEVKRSRGVKGDVHPDSCPGS